MLRGATEQIIGEAERSLHDALCVLTSTVKEPRTVFGGGCSEMLMAKAVEELAAKTAGKEARAMESFAAALRQLPSIIAENGGYDSAQLTSEMKAAHNSGKNTTGLNMVSEGQDWSKFLNNIILVRREDRLHVRPGNYREFQCQETSSRSGLGGRGDDPQS